MSGSQLTLFLTGIRDGVEDWCQHIPVDPDKDAQVTEGQQSRVPVLRGSRQTPQTGWQRAHEKCKLNLVVARPFASVGTDPLTVCVCTANNISAANSANTLPWIRRKQSWSKSCLWL